MPKIDLYSMLYQSLRQMDKTGVLRAIMDTFSQVLDETVQKVESLPDILRPDRTPGIVLPYLLEMLGVPADTVRSLVDVVPDRLRAWGSFLPIYWRWRGTREGLVRTLYAMTGNQVVINDFWDRILAYNGPWTLDQGTTDRLENQKVLYVWTTLDPATLYPFERRLLSLIKPLGYKITFLQFDYIDNFRNGLRTWTKTGNVRVEYYSQSPKPGIFPKRVILSPGSTITYTGNVPDRFLVKFRIYPTAQNPGTSELRLYMDQNGDDYLYIAFKTDGSPTWRWSDDGVENEKEVGELSPIYPENNTDIILIWDKQQASWYIAYRGQKESDLLPYEPQGIKMKMEVAGSNDIEIRFIALAAWPIESWTLGEDG